MVAAGSVSIEFSPPLERIQSALDEIGRDLSNMRTPIRESVRDVIIPSIDANFSAGGRPPWTPLSSETLERRARQGTGTAILQESGKLRTVATQQSRWSIGTTEAEITNWPGDVLTRAAVAQGGASGAGYTRSVTIPARPFLMYQPEDADKVEEIFLDWMGRRAGAIWSRG